MEYINIDDEFIATNELRFYETKHEMDLDFLKSSCCGPVANIKHEPHKFTVKSLQQKWISVLDPNKTEWRNVPTVDNND